MTRVTLEIDSAHVERLLGFEEVRKRFGRAKTTETAQSIPTLGAADLGIEAVDEGGGVPVLDVNNLEIVGIDEG